MPWASIRGALRVATISYRSMEFPRARIMVFAKAPLTGQVKTRLIPHLGVRGARALHEQLARYCIANAVQAKLCPVQLWCSPDREHPFFADCRSEFKIPLSSQEGQDLGERMAHAFEQILQECSYALVIGTDCPALTSADLREALCALQGGMDAVVGPAKDGGYVLLGLRRLARGLFEDIAWGEVTVLDTTRERMEGLQWRWHELAVRWDVDRPEDVERLMREDLLQGASPFNRD